MFPRIGFFMRFGIGMVGPDGKNANEVETVTGTVVHAFTSGAMVQVFLLTQESRAGVASEPESESRANDGDKTSPGKHLQRSAHRATN